MGIFEMDKDLLQGWLGKYHRMEEGCAHAVDGGIDLIKDFLR